MSASRFFHGAVMFRRVCLEDTGGWYREELPYAQDYDLWLRIAEAWDLANLPQVLYRYREHGAMVSAQYRDEQDRCVGAGRSSAVERRRTAGWNWVLGRREQSPRWMRGASRPRIAQRYLWWSAGVLGPDRRRYGLHFLLIALCAMPTYGPAWRYVGTVVDRKARSLCAGCGGQP
jgi:hypothetical protein